MKLVSLNDSKELEELSKDAEDYILHSMPHPSIGMIFGDKDVGKSRAMMSIAYSLALNVDLVGMLPTNPVHRKNRKVAIWDSENGTNRLAHRLQAHLKFFDKDVADLIRNNITIVHDVDSHGCQEFLFKDSKTVNHSLVDQIKDLVQDHDILFIDTIRSAIGYGDEISNDNDIKVILSEICHDANCSIVFIHHMRKSDVEKGAKGLIQGSNSGLARTAAKARVHYGVSKPDPKSDDTAIHILSANNLSRKERHSMNLSSIDMGEHSFPLSVDKSEDMFKILSGVVALEQGTLETRTGNEFKDSDQYIESDNPDGSTLPDDSHLSVLDDPDPEEYLTRDFVPDEERKYTIGKSPNNVAESATDRRRQKFKNLGIVTSTVKIKK